MSKKAFITGVTGQDGAYLTRKLLDEGYDVIGTYRRSSSTNFWRLEELGLATHDRLTLVEYDLTDLASAIRAMQDYEPDEVYNLAAQSFVGVSFDQPLTTAAITGIGPVNLLEAIRIVNPKIKFYQASTSEMFGKVQEVPQRETTPFYPRSPYGVAKLYAHWMVINYRESYDMFGSNGILFNHESPLRGREFVTRKITHAVASIEMGMMETLELGNLDAKRDWGYAPDFVDGIWRVLQADEPDDFVLATNRTVPVREFVEMAFGALDRKLEWSGSEESEVGRDASTGQLLVRVNPKFYRPAEVDLLLGSYDKAQEKLGWAPTTTLEAMAKEMVDADHRRLRESGHAF